MAASSFPDLSWFLLEHRLFPDLLSNVRSILFVVVVKEFNLKGFTIVSFVGAL